MSGMCMITDSLPLLLLLLLLSELLLSLAFVVSLKNSKWSVVADLGIYGEIRE